MRIILTIILACLLSSSAFAQAPTWAWASSPQNISGGNTTVRTALDKDNNVYSVGVFGGSISFGDSTYTSNIHIAIYVTKRDKNGNLIWSQFIGGPEVYSPSSIAVDSAGAVYIGGTTATDTPNATALWKDMLLVKLNASGQIAWRKWYGTKFNDEITGLAIDSKNNLVFTGYFSNSYLNDSLKLGDLVLVGQGDDDIFIAKIDSSGKVFWVRDIGSKRSENAYSLALTFNDAMVIVAGFDGGVTLDNLTPLRSICGVGISGDFFVAAFDSSGNAQWAQVVGGDPVTQQAASGAVTCTFSSIDSSGNVYVGGNYSAANLKIGSFVLPQPYDNQGSFDFWFAKISSQGAVLWAKRAGGMNDDGLYGLAADRAGNLYLTGEAGDACIFDSDTVHVPLTAFEHMYVAKYDDKGTLKWLKSNGGIGNSFGYDIVVNNDDEVVVVGGFSDAALAFGKSVVFNTGSGNGFVAKLNKEGVGVPPTIAGQFIISPNPASNTLQLQTQQAGQFSSYQISNALGQKVGSGILKSQTQQSIVLPDLVDGMYYLSLSGRAGVVTRKVIVQH
ncbi:MAG: SBBP repeat-containing protein, partial [Chitinophagaceae bacterium]